MGLGCGTGFGGATSQLSCPFFTVFPKFGIGVIDGLIRGRGDGGKLHRTRSGGARRGGAGGCAVFRFRVIGDLPDHVVTRHREANALGVFYGDVESAQDECGAFHIDGIAHEGVDDFHQRGLDGLGIFQVRDGMEARLGWSSDTAQHALMELAELFVAKCGRLATDSVDLDMSASFVRHRNIS